MELTYYPQQILFLIVICFLAKKAANCQDLQLTNKVCGQPTITFMYNIQKFLNTVYEGLTHS